jgi:hypothetical protein
LRVIISTSLNETCGIREHSLMLQAALREVAPEVDHLLIGPDPAEIPACPDDQTILMIDHQQGVHGQWTPYHIAALKMAGWKVVITVHDSFETFSLMQERGFLDPRGADAIVVHEPVEGLDGANVHFVRQGVLGPCSSGSQSCSSSLVPSGRPTVGSAGFPFPWKGFDALARASAAAGWSLLLLAPRATIEDCERWQSLNPNCEIIPQWLPREEIVARLSQCQATAWLYSGGGSGTSGAIRLGIAARRPLIAYRNRQFRDLENEPLMWAGGEDGVTEQLDSLATWPHLEEVCVDQVSAIASRDSWPNVAKRYLEIYKAVLEIKSL